MKPRLCRRWKFEVYNTLLSELLLEDGNEFKNYLQMAPENFKYIHHLVKDDNTKQDTMMGESIPPMLKLTATIPDN